MTKATLVYDADCRFCTRTAHWVERHSGDSVDARSFDDTEVPPGVASDRRSAHLIEGTSVRHGGAAMTGALRHLPGGRAAALLDLPGVSWLRDRAYRLVSRRHGPHAAREEAANH